MTSPAPARLPIPGGYQLTLKMSVGGQDAAIVLGGKGLGGWSGVQSATTWRDRAWAHLRSGMSANVSCTGAVVRSVSGSGEVIELTAPPTAPAGSMTGSVALLAGATLVKWTTAQGGRSGKGRTFLPGLPLDAVAAGGRLLISSHTTNVNASLASYLSDTLLDSAGIDPAVLSFRQGQAYTITGGSVATVVGIQRRRMR